MSRAGAYVGGKGLGSALWEVLVAYEVPVDSAGARDRSHDQ